MIHEEIHPTTLCSAGKVLVALFDWVNDEVPIVAILLERAEPSVPHALLLQRHKVAYDLHNVCRVQNLVDDILLNLHKKSLTIKGDDLFTIKGANRYSLKVLKRYIGKPNVRVRGTSRRTPNPSPIPYTPI